MGSDIDYTVSPFRIQAGETINCAPARMASLAVSGIQNGSAPTVSPESPFRFARRWIASAAPGTVKKRFQPQPLLPAHTLLQREQLHRMFRKRMTAMRPELIIRLRTVSFNRLPLVPPRSVHYFTRHATCSSESTAIAGRTPYQNVRRRLQSGNAPQVFHHRSTWAASIGARLCFGRRHGCRSALKTSSASSQIGIGYWCTHDSDVIPTEQLGSERQSEIIAQIRKTLEEHGVQLLDGHHRDLLPRVFSAGPAPESPEVRDYVAFRVWNNVDIGHEFGAQFAVYWPGSLGYFTQGAIDEMQTLRWYADALNAACERDIEVAKRRAVRL